MSSTPATPSGIVEALARRTGFSPTAVETMRAAVARGGSRMAQFDHPEFGGPGQWMHGGLLMLGDPNDRALRQRVAALCDALAEVGSDESTGHGADRSQEASTVAADGRWWPAWLGRPDASGAQNDRRYAWFAARDRLVVDEGGRLTVYDTQGHRLVGVSQQQGGGETVIFTGDRGPI